MDTDTAHITVAGDSEATPGDQEEVVGAVRRPGAHHSAVQELELLLVSKFWKKAIGHGSDLKLIYTSDVK